MVVADPMIPVMGCLVVYFGIALEMYSIAVITFDVILIYGGCVPVNFLGFLLTDPDVCSDVGNVSSEMPSDILGFNEGLKCRLLILRWMQILSLLYLTKSLSMDLKFSSLLKV